MKELLIPAGSMDALKAAIHNGADAVYLGGKKFGARAFATNFDDEEMISAIKLCHLYGVKIYVTVNTMVYESELMDAFNYLKFLHENNVDAVIVQDLGLISMARKYLPNLEIHASTQVHNTNQDGIDYLYKLGVKRVVFARELSLKEIDNINTPMEKEAFIHGALCVSYSGECLFSSMLMGRSGNRGECAQVCRLPYKLMEDDKIVSTDGTFLLSTKELNSCTTIEDILNSSVYSLKVEGRMKSPEYVACVTRLYRDLLDKFYRGEKPVFDKSILAHLSVIFNREYTRGFIGGENNTNIMNIKTSNHAGVHLGEVVKVDNKYIYIKLDKEVNQGDGIRFKDSNEGMILNFLYSKNTKAINKGEKDQIILVDNKFKVKTGEEVRKTLDILVNKKYENYDLKKIPIDVDINFNDNKMYLSFSDGENRVDAVVDNISKAINKPTVSDDVISKLKKLGNTPFELRNVNINNFMDDLFINMSDINEVRRTSIDKLISLRENKKKEVIIKPIVNDNNFESISNTSISVLVRNEDQYNACKDLNVDRIIVENKILFNKLKDDEKVLFRTSRIGDNTINYSYSTELGAINRLNKSISDYYLNVANHESINLLKDKCDIITLSVELSLDEIQNIMNYYHNKANVEIVVYSNVEVMIMKYCPLKLNVNKDMVCNVCSNGKKYYLVDRFDKKYRILNDNYNHLTHIMNYKPIRNYDNVSTYKSLGIKNYRVELLEEDYNESYKQINDLIELLK